MKIICKFSDEKEVEVSLKEGQLESILYRKKIVYFETESKKNFRTEEFPVSMEKEEVKVWMKDILKKDLEVFKEILRNLSNTDPNYDELKKLLDEAKERKWTSIRNMFLDFTVKINQAMEELEKYNLS